MKKTSYALCACLLATITLQASADIILEDYFDGTTITSQTRLKTSDIGWTKFSSSIWTTSNGTLSNASTSTDKKSEGGILQCLAITNAGIESYSTLTFSFKYSVGAGSTLYFHAIGLNDGTFDSGAILHNTGATSGTIQSQYDDVERYGDFTGYNLATGGTAPAGNAASAMGAIAGGTEGIVDATFTFDVNLTDDKWAGVTSINDFQYITMGFATDVTNTDGSGAVSIDDFTVTGANVVPEPATLGMLGLGALAIMAVRRLRG